MDYLPVCKCCVLLANAYTGRVMIGNRISACLAGLQPSKNTSIVPLVVPVLVAYEHARRSCVYCLYNLPVE